MKISGGFRRRLLRIFLFYDFLNPSFAQTVRPPPDIRPDDANTFNTVCSAKDAQTPVGCSHFPPHYGVVLCFYCVDEPTRNKCANKGGEYVCWRCDVHTGDNREEYLKICDSWATTTTTTTTTPSGTGEEDVDCQLWPLYFGWFVIIACLIYDSFLLLFFVPRFPGYARMRCWMGLARRPRDKRPKKRSAKRLEERKDPGVVEIEVEVDNTNTNTSSEVQPPRKSSKSLGRKKSKKGSGRKKSRKSQSVV